MSTNTFNWYLSLRWGPKSTGLNKHLILGTMGSSHLCRLLTLFYKELLLDSTLKIGISRWGLSKAALSSWFWSRRSRRADETGKERRITCINTFLFSHYSLPFLTEYTQYNVVAGFSYTHMLHLWRLVRSKLCYCHPETFWVQLVMCLSCCVFFSFF